MKPLNQYIKEKLIINKDYHDNTIVVKSFDELRNIVIDRYNKLGPGTKQNPIDFNDIDVSNLDSFYSRNIDKGIFEGIKFKHIDISDWDVPNAESMQSMFYGCEELESTGDLSNWDVSNVKSTCNMFFGCKELESVGDISNWDVSSVTNMDFMFYSCKKFNKDLYDWDVSNVRRPDHIFHDCPIKEEYKPKFK